MLVSRRNKAAIAAAAGKSALSPHGPQDSAPGDGERRRSRPAEGGAGRRAGRRVASGLLEAGPRCEASAGRGRARPFSRRRRPRRGGRKGAAGGGLGGERALGERRRGAGRPRGPAPRPSGSRGGAGRPIAAGRGERGAGGGAMGRAAPLGARGGPSASGHAAAPASLRGMRPGAGPASPGIFPLVRGIA